ncbi:MAG: hypothetical protein Q8873_02040 [Bacillota bacterium]|nr:hypothetical protein [Bacillota bacterium]
MDEEKNLNEVENTQPDQSSETEQDVEEADEVSEEKVRPEVYDDFAEAEETAGMGTDYSKEVYSEHAMKPSKIIAISSVIATIASIVILLLGSAAINLASGAILGSKIEGTWAYEISSNYGSNMKVCIILKDNKFTLASTEGMTYFTCKYKVTGKDTIELISDKESAAKMTQIGVNPGTFVVKYDSTNKSITLNPSIGGIATWTAVSKDEAAKISESIKNHKETSAPSGSGNTSTNNGASTQNSGSTQSTGESGTATPQT